MDLVFVVGGSKDENFDISGQYKICLQLADNIAEKYDIDRDKVRVALVTYGSLSQMTFDLQDYSDKALLKSAFLKAEYPGPGTETAQALDMVRLSVLPSGRQGHIAKVVVLITAGVSQDRAAEAAQQLKEIGVEIYTVGIGPEADRRQLEAIASDPKEDHVFVTAFEDAPSVAGPLSYTLSKGKCENFVSSLNKPKSPPGVSDLFQIRGCRKKVSGDVLNLELFLLRLFSYSDRQNIQLPYFIFQ